MKEACAFYKYLSFAAKWDSRRVGWIFFCLAYRHDSIRFLPECHFSVAYDAKSPTPLLGSACEVDDQ